MKAAVYLRVSTEAQTGPDRFGLAAQLEAINTYAAQQGFDIVATFEDPGISGATLDRPGLQAMISAASRGEFEAVIVAKMDRIARDLMAQLWIEKELLKHSVEIISAAEQFRGQDPANVLFRQIIGAFAEFEKSRITERMSGGRKQKAQGGGYAGGGAAIGYTSTRGAKVLELNQDKAATVQRVFEIHQASPGYSLRQIAAQLNQEGHTTAQDKPFQAVQVKRILDREALYSGQYLYAGIEAQGQHQAII
mgnify:FL=1